MLYKHAQPVLTTAWPHKISGQVSSSHSIVSHRPEPSVRAVHEEADGLDSGGQHGRLFALRHTGRISHSRNDRNQ